MRDAKKNDQDFRDKPPLALLPPEVLWQVGIVFGYGAEKYDADNWYKYKPADIRRLLSGVLRHIMQYQQGEYYDSGEAETLHLVNAIAGLMMAVGTHMKYQDEIEGTESLRSKHQEAVVEGLGDQIHDEMIKAGVYGTSDHILGTEEEFNQVNGWGRYNAPPPPKKHEPEFFKYANDWERHNRNQLEAGLKLVSYSDWYREVVRGLGENGTRGDDQRNHKNPFKWQYWAKD